jgi:hypothetical protein
VIKAVKKLCINNTICYGFIIHLFDEAFVLISTMKNNFLFTVFLFYLAFAILLFANKVSGIVVDKADRPFCKYSLQRF